MANDPRIEIEITLDDGSIRKGMAKIVKESSDVGDKSGKGFSTKFNGQVNRGLSSLTSKILGVGAALVGVFGTRSLIRAATQQQDAVNKLNTALAITGKFSEKTSKSMQDFAGVIQDTTKVGDDLTLETAALIQSLGKLSESSLKDATTAAIDLSTALNMDLRSAATLVGKAAAGQVETFTRYGIVVKKGATNAETFANALKAINAAAGGSAAAQINTFSGAWEQLANRFGDIKDEVGLLIIESPPLIAIVKSLETVFKNVITAIQNNKKEIASFISESIIRLIAWFRVLVDTSKDVFKFVFNHKEIILFSIALAKIVPVITNIGTAIKAVGLGAFVGKLGVAAAALGGISILGKKWGESIKKDLDAAPAIERLKGLNEALALQQEFLRKSLEAQEGGGFLDKLLGTNRVESIKENINQIKEQIIQTQLEVQEATIDPDTGKNVLQSIFDPLSQENMDLMIERVEAAAEAMNASFKKMGKGAKEGMDDVKASAVDLHKALNQTLKNGVVNLVSQSMQAIGASLVNGGGFFDQFLGIVLNALGDLAIAMGTTVVGASKAMEALKLTAAGASGIGIVMGLALIAIGGAMKAFGAQVSGRSSPSTTPAGGSAFSGSDGSFGGDSLDQPTGSLSSPDDREEKDARVQVVIQGDVLDSDETGLRIVNLLNDAFDKQGVVVNRGVA